MVYGMALDRTLAYYPHPKNGNGHPGTGNEGSQGKWSAVQDPEVGGRSGQGRLDRTALANGRDW